MEDRTADPIQINEPKKTVTNPDGADNLLAANTLGGWLSTLHPAPLHPARMRGWLADHHDARLAAAAEAISDKFYTVLLTGCML